LRRRGLSTGSWWASTARGLPPLFSLLAFLPCAVPERAGAPEEEEGEAEGNCFPCCAKKGFKAWRALGNRVIREGVTEGVLEELELDDDGKEGPNVKCRPGGWASALSSAGGEGSKSKGP
jgi:hypothetical protein